MFALVAAGLLLMGQAGPAPDVLADIRQIPTFLDEYGVIVSVDRVAIIRTRDGRRAELIAGTPRNEIGAAFAAYVTANEELQRKLGPALSNPKTELDNALTFQIFEGGLIVKELSTETIWTTTHARRNVSISFPDDPKAIVLHFDWRGGYTPPRVNNAPYLTIRADGLATLIDPFGKRPTVQKLYTRQQLDELFGFIVHQHRFFTLDSDHLAAEIKKGPRILDAGTSVLRVSANNRSLEVRCHAAIPYAEALPRSSDLQHFAAIERRLIQEMERMRPTER